MSSERTPGRWSVWAANAMPADWWARWESVYASAEAPPILDQRFVRPALQHFGDGTVFADYPGAGGVQVMAIVRRSSRVRWSLFQPSQAPLPFLLTASNSGAAPADLAQLLGRLSPLGLALDLPCLDPRFSQLDLSQPAVTFDRQRYGTTMTVTNEGGFRAYWESRPKSLKQNAGRYFRRIERDGLAWRLEVVTDASAMAEAVRRYGLLESEGWKGEAGSAVRADNAQGRFYCDVLQNFAATGDARVYFLHVGDRLAAARLTIRGHGTAVMLKTAFDESLGQYAPGRLITYLALEHMLEDPAVRRVEFYTKANRDALEWASEQRDLSVVTVFRHPVLLRAVQARRAVKARGST